MGMERPPKIDPRMPEVQWALDRIRLEIGLVRKQHPHMTEREAVQEARRRHHKALLAVVEAAEARQWLRRYGRRAASRPPTPLSPGVPEIALLTCRPCRPSRGGNLRGDLRFTRRIGPPEGGRRAG
jgi:hypothetical protein